MLTTKRYQTDLQADDFVWFLLRMSVLTDENKISVHTAEQLIPSWSSFNSTVSTYNRRQQIVGYLPVFPFSVTDPSTVYTCLKNFVHLLSQLNQEQLAVACDVGVYKIARHILENEEELTGIVLFLGGFHITKVLLSCIRKYIHRNRFIWSLCDRTSP